MYMPSGVVPIRTVYSTEENIDKFRRTNAKRDLIAKEVEKIA